MRLCPLKLYTLRFRMQTELRFAIELEHFITKIILFFKIQIADNLYRTKLQSMIRHLQSFWGYLFPHAFYVVWYSSWSEKVSVYIYLSFYYSTLIYFWFFFSKGHFVFCVIRKNIFNMLFFLTMTVCHVVLCMPNC